MRPPENWRNARVAVALALLISLAWLIPWVLRFDGAAAIWGGFISARIDGPIPYDGPLAPLFLTPVTATFVHGGPFHLLFNLLILLFCGRAVESILGSRGMVILYLVGAYAAAAAQYLPEPHALAPMIGASGAISAILGAYAMLFGRNRVNVAHPRLALWLNALWLAAAWVGLQLLVGFTFETAGAVIAVAAHIGGFIAGLLLAKPLLLFRWRGA